jgi:hypothetical protein
MELHLPRGILLGLAALFIPAALPAAWGENAAKPAEYNIDEGRRKPFPELVLKGTGEEGESKVREMARILALSPEQEELLRKAYSGAEPGESRARFEKSLTREQLGRLEGLEKGERR